MADYNSSLPVRTQNNGDVVIEVADGTTPSQKLAVSAAGSAQVAGQGVAGTPAGGVVSVQGVSGGTAIPISGTVTATNASVSTTGTTPPGSATYIGALAATSAPTLTTGFMYPPSLTLGGALRVDASATTQPISGTVTANQGTAAALAGAWPVEITDGTNILGTSAHPVRIDPTGTTTQPVSGTVAVSAISGTVAVTQSTSPWVVSDVADGSVTGGTAGTKSLLAGGVYNTSLPTLTTGQQAGLQLDSSGKLLVDGSTVTQPVSGTVAVSTVSGTVAVSGTVTANQGGAPWSQNLTQISGASPSATNALPAQIAINSAFVSSSNPLPVILYPNSVGTAIADYKDGPGIAVGSSDTHTYTVTSGKTLNLQSVESSSSGKAKILVQVETGVATGLFTVRGVKFNSTATPSNLFAFPTPIQVAAGVRVQVVSTNNDVSPQDLYSTILGYEA